MNKIDFKSIKNSLNFNYRMMPSKYKIIYTAIILLFITINDKMLDEIDKKILEILQKNARTPYTQIAKEVGLSEGAVRKRIEALEKKGIIKRYVAVIDPRKIGYNSITLLGLDAEPTKLLEIANEISKLKEAKNVYLTTGDHMIMAEIWAKDGKELSNILANKIAKIEGVKRICPAIILEKIKEE